MLLGLSAILNLTAVRQWDEYCVDCCLDCAADGGEKCCYARAPAYDVQAVGENASEIICIMTAIDTLLPL